MKALLCGLAAVSVLLHGCATTADGLSEVKGYVDSVLPPVKPSPQPAPTVAASGTADTREVCKKGVVSGLNDVDTAYGRAMQTFRFRTPAIVEQQQGAWRSTGYRHTVTPGAYYDLWDETGVIYTDGSDRYVAVGVTIQKANTGTQLSYRYCAMASEGPAFFAFLDAQFPKIVGTASTPQASGQKSKKK